MQGEKAHKPRLKYYSLLAQKYNCPIIYYPIKNFILYGSEILVNYSAFILSNNLFFFFSGYLHNVLGSHSENLYSCCYFSLILKYHILMCVL